MPFKRLIYVCSGALLFLCSCGQSYVEELSTQYADLKVNDKEHIFVAGSSGAGKSSICRLLMRIYDDYTGNILIGGVPAVPIILQ